jgi:uncharacterized protein with HEPN domain
MGNKVVEMKLDNFRKSVEVALNCFDPEKKLKTSSTSELIEALYRVSWRASEIPTQLKFVTEKSAKEIKVLEHKICMVLSERDWILLDYLAESLTSMQTNLQSNQFASLYEDLAILKGLFDSKNYLDKPQTSVQLASICGFVEISYDKYLIEKIQLAVNAFKDMSGDLSDSKTCYAIFRALEIIGESFKNLSDGTILKISDGKKIQKIFNDVRDQLHHSGSRTELIVEYNPTILEDFIKEVFPFIDNIFGVSENQVSQNNSNILAHVKKFTEILGRDLLISYKQIKSCLQIYDRDKKLLGKYLYRLNLQEDHLTQERLQEIKGNLNHQQVKDLYASQHTLPFVESTFQISLVDYKEKIIEWLKATTQEQEDGILQYHIIRNIPHKILFDAKKYQEVFDSLLKGKSSKPETIEEAKKNLAGYAWYQENQSLFRFTETELEEVKAGIADVVLERLSKIHGLISNDQDGKIFAKATLIFYNALAKDSKVVELLIEDLFRYAQDPASLLEQLSSSDDRFEEIDQVSEFKKIEGTKKQKLDDLLFSASFDITQEFKRDAEREKFEKTFRDCHKDHHKYFVEQKTPTNSSLRSESYSTSKILERIKCLEDILLDLNNDNLSKASKIAITLAAQYSLERIGTAANDLLRSQDFPDYGYLSVSKRQFLILNIARKSMAHHPIHIDDEKLDFYVEQLVLDSQFRLDRPKKSELQEKEEELLFGEEGSEFQESRKITFDDLRDQAKQILIKNIIYANGFSDEIIVFNKNMGQDIGVQGDIVFIVHSSTNDKFYSVVGLELELSHRMNCDARVNTFEILKKSFYNKLSHVHLTTLKSMERFDDFIVTKELEEIYEKNLWIQVRIADKDYYNSRQISLDDNFKNSFISASAVKYIPSQGVIESNTKRFATRAEEILQHNVEINNIIENKTIIFSQVFCQKLQELNNYEGFTEVLQNVVLDLDISDNLNRYFLRNEEKIKQYAEITKSAFRMRAFYSRDKFFNSFPELFYLKSSIEKVQKGNGITIDELGRVACDEKKVLFRERFDELEFTLSKFNLELVKHMQNNLIHFLGEKQGWLLQPAILRHFKEKYKDVGDVILVLDKNTKVDSPFAEKYGYLIQDEKEVQPEHVLFDFSGEVNYCYLEKQKSKQEELKQLNIPFINLVLDSTQIPNCFSGVEESKGEEFALPYFVGGILGFESMLDDLQEIHGRMSLGWSARGTLEPTVLVENFINSSNRLRPQGHEGKVLYYRSTKIDYRSRASVKKYTEELSEQDKQKIKDYYQFRNLLDSREVTIKRFNKSHKKAKDLKELIDQNINGDDTKKLQIKKLGALLARLKQDLELEKKLLVEICETSFVKFRIMKVLQNPFKLQSMIDYAKEKTNLDKSFEDILKSVIVSVVFKIKDVISQELGPFSEREFYTLSEQYSRFCQDPFLGGYGEFSGINLTLKGSSSSDDIDIGDINKYWGKYTLSAMSKILNLRIDELELKREVLILEGRLIDENNNNILSLIERVVLDDSNKTILVPLNLFNKHAVGLVFERSAGDVIKITYMDPSNEEIPQELKGLIYSALKQIDIEIEVVVQELSVESQKYANCGPEVIENFIYYLTGGRVSQEEAIELHSELMEQKLKYSQGDVVSIFLNHTFDNEDSVVGFAGLVAQNHIESDSV